MPALSLRCALLACALALVSEEASAQPCCAGGTTISPARLAAHERMLIGLALRFDRKLGEFDRVADYLPVEDEAQTGLREDLLISARLTERLQTGISVSYLQTWKRFGDDSDFGAGVGDLAFSLRYDFLEPGEHAIIPGIALATGVSVPIGKTTDQTTSILAADVTSPGYTQATQALSIADIFFDRIYVEAAAALTYWIPRSIDDLSVSRGLQFSASLGASWALAGMTNVGVVGTFELQGETETDGIASEGSSRRSTTLALIAAVPIASYRLQVSLFNTLPIDGLGRNEPAMLGLRIAIIRLL